LEMRVVSSRLGRPQNRIEYIFSLSDIPKSTEKCCYGWILIVYCVKLHHVVPVACHI